MSAANCLKCKIAAYPYFSGPGFVEWEEAAKEKEKLIKLIEWHGIYNN